MAGMDYVYYMKIVSQILVGLIIAGVIVWLIYTHDWR